MNRRYEMADEFRTDLNKELLNSEIIIGKIANDTTNPTLIAYLNGLYGNVKSQTAIQFALNQLMPDRLKEQYCFLTGVTVLIPVSDDRPLDATVDSVLRQLCSKVEILILRNGCNQINDGKEITIRVESNLSIKKIFIQEKGKGNALNVGTMKAAYDIICVLDADCLLQPDAFKHALRHFRDEKVVAVGGRLLTMTDSKNNAYQPQSLEYKKTFNLIRPLFDHVNANFIISGAFGMFRKTALQRVGGYDTDTVGEDMELVLRLQEHAKENGWKVVYEKNAKCSTYVPRNLYRLCRQRERWQRGLLDCLKKHKGMIGNPKHGLLGTVALPYQVISELLGPIFLMFHLINIICAVFAFNAYFVFTQSLGLPNLYQSWIIYGIYVLMECMISIWADLIDQKKGFVIEKRVPVILAITFEGILLTFILAFAKIYGMITFRWRRLVW